MAIDIDSIKRLKDLSGVGLTDAKKALENAGGDFDKALKEMRKKGLTKAEKRSQREARAGIIGTYNHDNRIGVLLEVNCETDFVARNDIFKDLVKDLAMHIAAMDPQYVSLQDVPSEIIKKTEQEFSEKNQADKKPAEMIKKIIASRVEKYFKERCLLEQPFVKDPEVKVGDFIKEHSAKLGENIVVRRFTRYELGQTS